jgi:hypothetical protein
MSKPTPDRRNVHAGFDARRREEVSKIVMGEVRKPEPSAGQCIHKLSVPRSADLKSAVSQDCILLGLGVAWGVEKTRHAADFKSAIRQSALRAQESPTTRGCTVGRPLEDISWHSKS